MKTLISKRTILLISILLFVCKSEAQVSTYIFSSKQSNYQYLNSPTILFSGYFYNQVSDAIVIPSFKYNGKFYDSLYLCSNGYLSFGPDKPGYSYYPISQYLFDEGIISAFGNGLVSKTNGNPQIAYQMIGNKLIFEWKDMRRFNMGSSENINFQIVLNYSDYSIQFVYGTMTPMQYNFNTQQVGIRGNHYNDYLNLEIDGNNNWDSPGIGKSNNAICYFNSDKPNIKPQSGLTYVFTPSHIKKKCDVSNNNPFTIEHFTSTNHITKIVEEGNYLWVGTQGGLLKRHKSTGKIVAKYDMSNGLPRNRITDIVIDHLGNKWIACEKALAKFDGQNWDIYNYKNTKGALVEDVHCLEVDWNGNIWIGSYWSGRLVKYNGFEWTVYNSSNTSICNDGIMDIEIDPYNRMWIGTKNGFTIYDGITWTCYNTSNSGLVGNRINDIYIGNGDTVWFATNDGISFYKNSTWGSYTTANSSIFTNAINCIESTPDGYLWVGTWGYGLLIYDGTNWYKYQSHNSGISDNVINTFLVDGQSDIWIGTYYGLNKVWNNKFYNYIQNKEVSGAWITNIIPDINGDLWFTSHSGLSKYSGGEWTNYGVSLWQGDAVFYNDSILWIVAGENLFAYNIDQNTYSESKPANQAISRILKDKNGNIWITTYGEGIKKYDGSTWTSYNTSNSNLPDNHVSGIAMESNGNLWFSTHSGVAKFDGTNWTTYDKNDIGINTNQINDIDIDYSGNIWIAADWSGAIRFDGTNWNRYTINSNLISNDVNISCQKDENIVWFGSYEGVSRYDGNTIVSYSNENGLPEESINNVYVHHGIVWLATQAGASKMTYKKPAIEFFANTACYPEETYLSAISCFTDPGSTYQWDVDNDGVYDYFSKNLSYKFPNYGNYNVKLRVSNKGQADSLTKNVTVGLRPNISLSPNGEYFLCTGASQTLNTTITNYNSQFNYKYEWNTGDTLSSIVVNEEDQYKVRVGIESCYSEFDSVNLKVLKPFDSVEICMVTVDPTTGKNLIIWERHQNRRISSYNIYKLFGSTYLPIGNVAFNQLSVFIDYTSDPNTRAARYAISVIDTCGNESPISPYHQTIHLGASKGTKPNSSVLDWTDYIDESGNYKPGWYYIYKGSTPNNLILHDSVSGSFTEWNDTNANGAIFYQVTATKQDICSPAVFRAQNYSGPYSQSLSNIKDYGTDLAPYLHVSPTYQIIANKTGTSATFNVFTNADSFEIDCPENWVDISVNDIANFFIVTANSEHTGNRSAKITIKAKDVSPVEVTLVQGNVSDIKDLEQAQSLTVYPNPFSRKANIRYYLVHNNKVKIEVYNQMGQIVKTLVDENQSAGTHLYEFNPDQYADGFYIIKMQVNDISVYRKLIQLK